MARAFALVLFFLLGTAGSVAAPAWKAFATPVFVRVDTQALPEAAVMAVAQDRSGLLWVGTQGGLARFDGYGVRNFFAHPDDPSALPDAYVRTLLADPAGGMWIGASSNGLVHFDRATQSFRTWHPDPSGMRGPRSSAVNALALGTSGVWVGGDRGLGRYDPTHDRFTIAALPVAGEQPVVWATAFDRGGTLWVGTQAGLFRLVPGAQRFARFALPTVSGRAAVYSVFEDRERCLWVGAGNAIFAIDGARRTTRAFVSSRDPASVAPGQQLALTEMAPGVVWSGTDSTISIVDVRSGRVQRVAANTADAAGLPGGRVLQFLHDAAGDVWLANHVGGLLLYNPRSEGRYQLSASRPDIALGNEGAVAVTTTRDGTLWAGGGLGSIVAFAPTARAPRRLTVPNHGVVETMLADGADIWIGTANGLCRIRAAWSAPRCLPAFAGLNIYSLLRDGRRMWVGGSHGLIVVDLASGRITPFGGARAPTPLTNSQVRVLYRDRERRLWIGTENGLNRLDPDGRLVRYLSVVGSPSSIGPGGITSVIEDRRGRIWAAANGGPLNVIDVAPNGATRVRHLGRADGLPHENVDGLIEDPSGRIWASTDRGIAVIDATTLRARAVGVADGLTDAAFWAGSAARAADGTMIFGGLAGISVVAPTAVTNWTYAPPIVVSGLEVGHRVATPMLDARGATVELPVDARDLTVEFAALDYSAPPALRYQYRLEGYDRDWFDADAMHRVATYSHVPPGRYVLDVRGTNRVGVWSRNELRLNVRVLPAWYETWWFRTAIVFLVALAIYGAYLSRTAVLRSRARELEAIVGRRTRELSAANTRLEELSLSDPLTGLRNRRFLTQHLDAEIAVTLRRYDDWCKAKSGAAPHDVDLLFFLIDLDHLKVINDRYGHHAGDEVLVQMRERLNEVFRESDFVVRWGGDEFLAVARMSRRDDAATIAERIHEAVTRRPFAVVGSDPIAGSVSVGFAAFPFIPNAPRALSWSQVVRLADHALYMAKNAGRNTWFGFAASAQTDAVALVRSLEYAADDAVRVGALDVISAVQMR